MNVIDHNRWVFAQEYDTTKPLFVLLRHSKHNKWKDPMLSPEHLQETDERAVKPLVDYLQRNPQATVRFAHSASSWRRDGDAGTQYLNPSIIGEGRNLRLNLGGNIVLFRNDDVNTRAHGMVAHIRDEISHEYANHVSGWADVSSQLMETKIGAAHEQGSSLVVPGLNNAELTALKPVLQAVYEQNKDTMHVDGGPLQHVSSDDDIIDLVYSLWAHEKEHMYYAAPAEDGQMYNLNAALQQTARITGSETSRDSQKRHLTAIYEIDSALQTQGTDEHAIVVLGGHGENMEGLGAVLLDAPYATCPGHVTAMAFQVEENDGPGIRMYANKQAFFFPQILGEFR